MKSLKKEWLLNVLIVSIATVVTFMCAELLLRIVLPRTGAVSDREIRMPDSALGYTLIPGSPVSPGFVVDVNGFNNESVPELADIVALGDSMTFGQNGSVSQNWP